MKLFGEAFVATLLFTLAFVIMLYLSAAISLLLP